MQNVDLSDWGGKQTLARACALRALLFDGELPATAMHRAAVEQVDVGDIPRLRAFGLQPVFGADITADSLYAGPMVVPHGSPLAQGVTHDVLVAKTDFGTLELHQDGDTTQRMVAGVVADVRAVMRSSKPALAAMKAHDLPMAAREPQMAYVRLPYSERSRVLALKPAVLQEEIGTDGYWLAVVEAPQMHDLRLDSIGGVVLPLAGAWEPVAAAERGLRLVG